jgi:deazaflavin-dependent oxidoreductase (nitroreductase family)
MATAPPKAIMKAVTRLHIFLYHLSGGKILGEIVGMPVLLLTTTGRKSGQPRTTPLVYHREGDDYLIAASNGGVATHPAWYYNLTTTPEVQVEVAGRTFRAEVTILTGAARDQVYESFKASSDNFVRYEQTAPRTIPVIRLTPKKEKIS